MNEVPRSPNSLGKMAKFAYIARTKAGQKVEGFVEASDRRAALMSVERMGHIPVSLTDAVSSKPQQAKAGRFQWRLGRPRMSGRELLIFTTELSDLLAAGLPVGNALNLLANRKTGGPADSIVEEVRDEIIRGASLSDALAKHPESFSRLYVSMVRAGEAGGALHEVLRRLIEHYERVQELKEKIIMALVYPAIVIVVGVVTLIFSMIYVIPKFRIIFDQMNVALPLPTRILIGLSGFLVRYGWGILIAILIAATLLNRWIKTQVGRLWWDGMLLKLPVVRGIVFSGILANLARTLGTLLSNGVPALQALAIAEQTVGNAVLSREIRRARERVTDGTTISGPLAAGGVFPPMMTDMLAVGEQTGDMAGSLGHIARRYENELNRNVKLFTTLLEPILIVFVAFGVGFVALSVLMAVFNLTNGLDV